MNSIPPLFTLRPPEAPEVPLIVNIPHAGTFVPADIDATFASDAIRALPMTDWHLPHLYDFLPSLGVSTLYANVSRFVIDLNRPPDAAPLYPGRFETGLVATQTFQGDPIFRQPPDAETVERRRVLYHQPYHQKLSELVDEKLGRFGTVVLIDAHSVASSPNKVHDRLTDDIYLGNRDGNSSEHWLIDEVARCFASAGMKVARNEPYKGGYITAHYGHRPKVQALQIEMCQRLYMDEENQAELQENSEFLKMQRVLKKVVRSVISRRNSEIRAIGG
ncbi:MAG: N-formylglutamate deformylase [Gammaproteobacteria bacterium]|nr:N-formylglutamate deformylase [Gammaproteobacteria bacterium]